MLEYWKYNEKPDYLSLNMFPKWTQFPSQNKKQKLNLHMSARAGIARARAGIARAVLRAGKILESFTPSSCPNMSPKRPCYFSTPSLLIGNILKTLTKETRLNNPNNIQLYGDQMEEFQPLETKQQRTQLFCDQTVNS